jgi:uncharacterized membrane protein YfcA
MERIAAFLALGVTAGAFSGLIGIGGGVIIVPALVFLLGYSQHVAQGTTLALLVPPIGLAAALVYWRQGAVDLQAAGWICGGFVAGSLLGARVAQHLPDATLERIFGVALLAIAVKMIFFAR